ncbi:MAG: site-specific integrase [Pseudomonadota bacterium]
MKLSELSTGSIEELRRQRLSEGAAPNTIDNEVKVLSRIYHLARDVWKVALPTEPVSFTKFNPRGKLRYFTPDEEAAILAELDPNRPVPWRARNGSTGTYRPEPGSLVYQQMQDNYDLAVFLLDTGARYSEAGTVPWVCIDTIHWEWIDLYRSKNDTETRLTMTDRLREVLQRRRLGPGGNGAYIFPSYCEEGADAPRGKSTRALRAAISRAGCNEPPLVKRYGRATVHTFRDTFASRLVQNGVTLYEVQHLLGHSDPRQTQKYAKLAPNQTASKAAQVLNRLAAE